MYTMESNQSSQRTPTERPMPRFQPPPLYPSTHQIPYLSNSMPPPNQMPLPLNNNARMPINTNWAHQSTYLPSIAVYLMDQMFEERNGYFRTTNVFSQNPLQRANRFIEGIHITAPGEQPTPPNAHETFGLNQRNDPRPYFPDQPYGFYGSIFGQHMVVLDSIPPKAFKTCSLNKFSINVGPDPVNPKEVLAFFQERLTGWQYDEVVHFVHTKLNQGMPPVGNSDRTLLVLSVKFTPEFYNSSIKLNIFSTILVHCLKHLGFKLSGRYFCYPDVQDTMTVEFDVYRDYNGQNEASFRNYYTVLNCRNSSNSLTCCCSQFL